MAFSPAGKLVARFEKVHRVPFGEYIPYRGFFKHLADLSSVPLDAIPGHGNGVLHTPAGPLGTLVSYEVFYAERGPVATRAGAQLLVDPTNTSSYLTSQVPTQEIAAARIQAIAEGRDVVQAAPTGFSAVIDHRGRVLARIDLGVPRRHRPRRRAPHGPDPLRTVRRPPRARGVGILFVAAVGSARSGPTPTPTPTPTPAPARAPGAAENVGPSSPDGTA